MPVRSAVVVGSGPNGLAAAIELARAGIAVDVREGAPTPGGGVRTAEITLPGFRHDLGSAVHPLGVASPFFDSLHLERYGLEWRWSPAEVAHPLDDGTAVLAWRSVSDTAAGLGHDADAYKKLFRPVVRNWDRIMEDVLQPIIHIPRHPIALGKFGLRALLPASFVAKSAFAGVRARALFGGFAAHSVLKLSAPISSSFAFMMAGSAHAVGWPIPVGGAQAITDALVRVLHQFNGTVRTNSPVTNLEELSGADLKMLDLTPRQVLKIAGQQLPPAFRKQLSHYRYGPGVFKVDWALREPIPWKAKECAKAITVHVVGTLEEVEESERRAWEGLPPAKPFVLLAQPSLFDQTRAPQGKHTAWAYCHVPNGWEGSALEAIENQIERFAPAFRDCVLARATHTTSQLQGWNPNLVGGDVGGGAVTFDQFMFRPTPRYYRTPLPDVFICSSSTPPGGAVHGMCGYNAARAALRTI